MVPLILNTRTLISETTQGLAALRNHALCSCLGGLVLVHADGLPRLQIIITSVLLLFLFLSFSCSTEWVTIIPTVTIATRLVLCS